MVEAVKYKTTSESIEVTSTTSGSSADVLYTCPAVHDATIDMIMITNGATSSQKISIQFYHDDDSTYHNFIKEKSIAGNTAHNVLDSARMHLHAGDKIVCYKDGGTFDVTISVREFYNPNR